MSTYVIGDIQGCFDACERLLKHIAFDATRDTLWFTGDLVNRGLYSLETVRFIQALGPQHITVLGNHDLHCLAVYYGTTKSHRGDTLDALLKAPDAPALMAWLQSRPLFYTNDHYALVHAGLHPAWTVQQALQFNTEIEQAIQQDPLLFFQHLYGNTPAQWSDALQGADRLRCITNYFTRLRFCKPNGEMDFTHKHAPGTQPAPWVPWFTLPRQLHLPLLFGHWASLHGETQDPNAIALDTGCVWGHTLTALRLEDQQRFQVPGEIP